MRIMFFKNLNKDRNNKLAYIVFFCFCVAILLIVLSFYLVNKAANSSKNILDYVAENSLEKLKSYNLEYDLTVFGNKTTNKYNLQEEYKKIDDINEYFKFNINSDNVTNFTYEFNNNSLKIYSKEQLNVYEIPNYNINKVNLYSLATFLNIYNEIKSSNCNCNNYCNYIEYENDIILEINFKDICKDNESLKEYNEILKNVGMSVSKLELVLNKDNMLPKKYIGYSKEDKACFEIIYNKVQID